MKKLGLVLLICFYALNLSAVCQGRADNDSIINDGPYIFYVNDTLKAKMIENGLVKEYLISPENFSEIKPAINLSCDYNDLMSVYSQNPDYRQKYNNIDSIVAISDVHGQYSKYIEILKANGVIDKSLNWNFGKGHLVFLGDAFDRGDRVTELLWHLFTLEKQAEKAGGMVHVMLGNHEDMVFSGDLRYMNPKYKKVEVATNTSYPLLYSENAVLGRWLRNKPVMVTVNNILFVHAGISIDMVRMKLPVKQVNKLFAQQIIGKYIAPDKLDEEVTLLAGNNGPLWYRGYFDDSTFNESKIDSILMFYDKLHIVVGHTTFKNMNALFNKKVIGIDSGIGYDQPGEVLIYKNGNFYIGSIKGSRSKL
jgi:hypothetical protein